MEGARRIDEWSRIADKVPHLAVIPELADVGEAHAGLLDLRPTEWEMLTMIDGTADLKAIATSLGRSEFDVARFAYGLVTTGVITLRQPSRVSVRAMLPVDDVEPHVDAARAALEQGQAEVALVSARHAVNADPQHVIARRLAARALMRLGRHAEAADELRRAAQSDPSNAEVSLDLAFAAARQGQVAEAVERWTRYLHDVPHSPHARRVQAALDATRTLTQMIEEHVHVAG
jgi:tetratricopeptide (TPR) repeat protein